MFCIMFSLRLLNWIWLKVLAYRSTVERKAKDCRKAGLNEHTAKESCY